MQIEEIINEDFYALFAPDGSFQCMTLAPDFASCVAIIKMQHKARLSPSYHELTMKGFEVMPVHLTVRANGTAEEGYQRARAALS